jgi:hypothetical protein
MGVFKIERLEYLPAVELYIYNWYSDSVENHSIAIFVGHSPLMSARLRVW